MINLHRFFMNPFDDDEISMDELLAFSTDHLERLKANNPGGIYAARITATTTAIAGVNTAFSTDESKLGDRKASKQNKNAYRKSLAKKISPLALAVESKFGEGSAEFAKCFPKGRRVFGDSADDQLGNHLQTLITGLTAYQGQLGAQVVTDATALLTGWNAVYAPSESSTGAKTTTQVAKNAARAALQLELFKNLLTIALNFPGSPTSLDTYMQQSLLEDHPAAPPTPPTPPPPGP